MNKTLKEKIEEKMPLGEFLIEGHPEYIAIKTSGSYDDLVDAILKIFHSEVEGIMRENILYIGNEIPEALMKDKRDKFILLGFPQKLLDDLKEV